MDEDTKLFGFDEPEAPRRGRPKKPLTVPQMHGKSLLSDADDEALREEAARIVAKEHKDIESKQRLEKYIAQARGSYDPEHETKEILIDLPGHSKDIRINGFPYLHGQLYTVSVSLYRSLNEVMNRAWKHELSVKMANMNNYVVPSANGIVLRPSDLNLMRV